MVLNTYKRTGCKINYILSSNASVIADEARYLLFSHSYCLSALHIHFFHALYIIMLSKNILYIDVISMYRNYIPKIHISVSTRKAKKLYIAFFVKTLS